MVKTRVGYKLCGYIRARRRALLVVAAWTLGEGSCPWCTAAASSPLADDSTTVNEASQPTSVSVATDEAHPDSAVSPRFAAYWGVQELGPYLVLVDGIPVTSIFSSTVERVDLAAVETVEATDTIAPVRYAMSPALGVIQLSRYNAALTPGLLYASVGSFSSGAFGISSALPSSGAYSQALSLDGQRDNLRGEDVSSADAHLLYRGEWRQDKALLRLSIQGLTQTDNPSSPFVRAVPLLIDRPLDANDQPPGSRLGSHRWAISADYTRVLRGGEWRSAVAWQKTTAADLRGFLRLPFFLDAIPNADGYTQSRSLDTIFLDSHIDWRFSNSFGIALGVDFQSGQSKQFSETFTYNAPVFGSLAALQPRDALQLNSRSSVLDQRRNAGVYGQVEWRYNPRLEATAALRFSHNAERRESAASLISPGDFSVSATDSTTRQVPSAGVGLRWHAWGDIAHDNQGLTVRMLQRETSQPAPLDLGPAYTPDILKASRSSRTEFGLREVVSDEQLGLDAMVSRTRVNHLILPQADPLGNPQLATAGNAALSALDLTIEYRPAFTKDWHWTASGGLHKANFDSTVALENGVNVDLSGHDLSFSARQVAAVSASFDPALGTHAALSLNYTGRRYLDRLNQSLVGGYSMLEGKLGYRARWVGLLFKVSNLTNRREPVEESEFGDEAFYRLAPRKFTLEIYSTWR